MVPKPNGGSPPDPLQDHKNTTDPPHPNASPHTTPTTTNPPVMSHNTHLTTHTATWTENDDDTAMLIDTADTEPTAPPSITNHTTAIINHTSTVPTANHVTIASPEKENKNKHTNTITHDTNFTNTTPPSPEPPVTTAEFTWIPIRVDWVDKTISKHKSIINNNINEDNAHDNRHMDNHPIPLKLMTVVNIIQHRYPDSQLKTSKDTILTKNTLIKQWTVNQVKHEFDYYFNAHRNRIITTLWLRKSPTLDLTAFRRPLIRKLRTEQVFLDPHYGSMTSIATAAVGWYYGIYPDAYDMASKEFQLNKALQDKFNDEKTAIMEWCRTHKNIELQKWDGISHFPHVTVEMMRPTWRPKDTKNLTTRVVGLRGSTKFRELLSKLITEIDLQKNNGTASFVPNDMQYAGAKMFEQYGKIITMQQKVIRDHDHIIIVGMTRYEMGAVQTELEKLPGIHSINGNRHTATQGKWNLLTDSNLPHSTLEQIDDILRQAPHDQFHPHTMRKRPERIQKDGERVPQALQNAWAKQTSAITRAMDSAPVNAWRKQPKIPTKSTKLKWASDDKSITTTATTSVDMDRVEQEQKRLKIQLKELLVRLEHVEKENNALKNMKSTVKSHIKQTEKYHSTTTKHLQAIEATALRSTETIADTVANMTVIQNTQNADHRHIEVLDTRHSLLENKVSHIEATTAQSLSQLESMMVTLLNRVPPQEVAPNGDSKRSRDTSTLTSPEYNSPLRKKNDTAWNTHSLPHTQDTNMSDNESAVYDDDNPPTSPL